MREIFRRSGKQDKKVSTTAKIFGSVALATGLALCPMKAKADSDKPTKTEVAKKCHNKIDVLAPMQYVTLPPECATIIANIIEKLGEDRLGLLDELLDNQNLSQEVLEATAKLSEKSGYGLNTTSLLINVNAILAHDNYSPEVLNTISLIADHPDKDSNMAVVGLYKIIDNDNYNPEILENVNLIIKKYGKNSEPVLHMLNFLLGSPNFKDKVSQKEFSEEIFAVSDVIFANYAGNSFNVFLIMGALAQKENFTEDMFDAVYTKQICNALLPIVAKGEDVTKGVYVITRNNNFDLSMFPFALELVDKTKENSEYALISLYWALSNKSISQEFCTDDFLDDYAYLTDFIVANNPDYERKVMVAFGKLVQSEEFKPELIDERYAQILSTISRKMAEDGQVSFDYEKFLENWGKKPKMPNKKFEAQYDETIDFILNKTDEQSKDVILAVDELVRNPNFEQSLFPTVKKIVEMTTSECVPWYNVVSGEWSEPFSKYSTEAPKYLLDFDELLLNHSDLSEKELEKVMLFIEESGDLQVLDAMFANPVFRLEMLDQENLDRARDIVEQVNTANSDKTGGSLDADDLEILTNFSYALNVFKDDKDSTKEEKIKKLNHERGMIYFARYSEKMLNHTYSSLDPNHKKDRPVAYAAFNQNDWNKSFYWKYDDLDKLLKHYNVIIYEMESEDKFYDSVKETAEKHGRIDSLVIAGHGQAKEVNLGSGSGEASDIDTGDEKELEALNPYLVDEPTVILIACSSGHTNNSIGAKLSDIWYATVWAPDEPTSLKNISTYKNGKIKKVEYYDDLTNKFENGVMVLKRDKPYDEPNIPPEGLVYIGDISFTE